MVTGHVPNRDTAVPDGSATWAAASSGVSGASHTVTGLIAGLTYQFNVFTSYSGIQAQP